MTDQTYRSTIIMPKNDKKAFYEELNKLLTDRRVQNLNNFSQHSGTTTLRHVIRVAEKSFDLAERLGWDIDEKELAKGALLHDYYQYEIKKEGLSPYKHGTRHPGIAARKAEKDFGLTDKEENIIRSHMWPLTFWTPPRSKEAALVCMADKYIATQEMVFRKF